jgi:hypothetical protein
MRRRKQTWVVLLMATLPFLGGCYTWAALDRAEVVPGATVRITLGRDEAVRQIDVLGGLRESVEGRVADQSNEGSLALTVRQSATPSEPSRFNAFLSVPWGSVGKMEVKRFSPLKTGAIVAGAGVVAVLTLSVLEGSSSGGPGEGPGTNDAVRIPLIRIYR